MLSWLNREETGCLTQCKSMTSLKDSTKNAQSCSHHCHFSVNLCLLMLSLRALHTAVRGPLLTSAFAVNIVT